MNAIPTGVTDALRALHFLRPQWLWLLLVLPLLAWWWRRRRLHDSVWRGTVDPHLLPHLLQGGRAAPGGRSRLLLALLGIALAIAALAGPSWQRSEQPLWQSRTPLVIALDLSPTITASDLPPTRLAQARATIARLLQQRNGGQVGLVVYAEDAYTVAPLTDDAANVALFLDALSPGIMPGHALPGSHASDAGRAIAWSADLLRQAGFDHGDILLLTGSAGGDASHAASRARDAGYRVSVLGLGTAAGSAYRDGDGDIAHARLDAASLRKLASAGGGDYAALSSAADALSALGVLDPRRIRGATSRDGKTRIWQDQGYWLLLPVLLLAALAFRRGGMLAALLMCAWLPLAPVHAQTQSQAHQHPPTDTSDLDGGWWRRADQQQHRQLLQGADAYRKQDYAAAARNWRGLPGADAAYNRGNALARQGDYPGAIAQYDHALRLHPGMADAIANKQAVEAAMKRKPPAGGNGKQQGGTGNGAGKAGQGRDNGNKQSGNTAPDKDKDAQGQVTGQSSGASSARRQDWQPHDDASSKDQSGDTPQAGHQAQPDMPADTAAQQRADAAQRQRMQQALQRAPAENRPQAGQAGQAGEAQAAQPGETQAERERRLANEARLRRVPDDPGGLLRARFRLEHERRLREGHR